MRLRFGFATTDQATDFSLLSQPVWIHLCSYGDVMEDKFWFWWFSHYFWGVKQQKFCCWSIRMTKKRRRNGGKPTKCIPFWNITWHLWCVRIWSLLLVLQAKSSQTLFINQEGELQDSKYLKGPAPCFKGRFVASHSTRCGVLYMFNKMYLLFILCFLISHLLRFCLSFSFSVWIWVFCRMAATEKTSVLKTRMMEVIHHRMLGFYSVCEPNNTSELHNVFLRPYIVKLYKG